MPKPLHILIVDDNRIETHIGAELMRRCGHNVETAAEGTDALHKARRERPAVVLCDIHLPQPMDGYAVVKQMRSEPTLNDCLCIAVSGSDEDEVAEKAKAAGFDLFLQKPIHYMDLCHMFGQWLETYRPHRACCLPGDKA